MTPQQAGVSADIEAISAKVHEQWMESKRKLGVATRKSESGEELMVPYEQLSDAAKDLDRGSVRAVLAAQEALATAPPEQAARHGYDCVKVRHETKRSGYLHDELDDGPYDVDGVLYCGRCHIALSRSGISGKQLQAMLLTWFDRYHKFTDISVDMLPHQAAEKVFKELRQFVAESLI